MSSKTFVLKPQRNHKTGTKPKCVEDLLTSDEALFLWRLIEAGVCCSAAQFQIAESVPSEEGEASGFEVSGAVKTNMHSSLLSTMPEVSANFPWERL